MLRIMNTIMIIYVIEILQEGIVGTSVFFSVIKLGFNYTLLIYLASKL